jgi:hypothetical protein
VSSSGTVRRGTLDCGTGTDPEPSRLVLQTNGGDYMVRHRQNQRGDCSRLNEIAGM